MKPVAAPALCAALLLSGCADLKRSTCVRSENRSYYSIEPCRAYDNKGRCTRLGNSGWKTTKVCVERICDPGFDYGPNKPTNSFLVPRGCLTKEEAEKSGQG